MTLLQPSFAPLRASEKVCPALIFGLWPGEPCDPSCKAGAATLGNPASLPWHTVAEAEWIGGLCSLTMNRRLPRAPSLLLLAYSRDQIHLAP